MIYKSCEEETDTKGLYNQGKNQSIRKYEGPSNSSHTFFLAVTGMK